MTNPSTAKPQAAKRAATQARTAPKKATPDEIVAMSGKSMLEPGNAGPNSKHGGRQEPPSKSPKGKLGEILALLNRPEGATLAAMMEATNWQAHSVRGALSGALKKKLGLMIVSEVVEAGRIYRISGDPS